MTQAELFKINMPYGVKRNIDKNKINEWSIVNRYYKPLGQDRNSWEKESYSRYKSLTEDIIKKIACPQENRILKDNDGNIKSFFLYSGTTNPYNKEKYEDEYFERVEMLSNLKIN